MVLLSDRHPISRREQWADAEIEFNRRASFAKFLYGCHYDRQTGADLTHPYRREFGISWPARKDHALLRTVGADGQSRATSWTRNKRQGIRMLTPYAERIRAKTYRPGTLKIARWTDARGKIREIAFPSVIDRLIGSVLLEVIEPVIDPVLSEWQHGYRPSRIDGHRVEIPGFTGVPRGSTKIVATRLFRGVSGRFSFLAEIDIKNAFPSVDRSLLRRMLIEDGCSKPFAKVLVRFLGSWALDGDQKVRVSGIPLGTPVGPLLFNFFVRGIHDVDLPESLMASYADNFFICSSSEKSREMAIKIVQEGFRDHLKLESKIEQRWNPNDNYPFTILEREEGGGYLLEHGRQGRMALRGPGVLTERGER